LTLTVNTTIYAKWISTSALAPYVGVWRYSQGEHQRSYILLEDDTGWEIRSSWWFKGTWSPSQIDGEEVSFNETKTEFTRDNDTFTKNTTETKTPAAVSNLAGVWVPNGESRWKLELKNDTAAVITFSIYTLTLGYVVEGDSLYLLQETTNLVFLSISLTNGTPRGFLQGGIESKSCGNLEDDPGDGQDYYYDLKADGTGTFHTLGASVAASFTVTQDEIDGESYAVSGDTLTVT
jgi:hypothetical protein